jgi:hypothetical protein
MECPFAEEDNSFIGEFCSGDATFKIPTPTNLWRISSDYEDGMHRQFFVGSSHSQDVTGPPPENHYQFISALFNGFRFICLSSAVLFISKLGSEVRW